MLLNPPHLLIGMRRSCQVSSARLLRWPSCSPLNRTWLTAMLTGSTKPKLLILCCTPRETAFSCHLLCWRRAETKSQTIAHDRESSAPAYFGHAPEESPGARMPREQLCNTCNAATMTAEDKLLPSLNPGQQRVTSPAPYRDKSQEPQFSCRASQMSHAFFSTNSVITSPSDRRWKMATWH